MWEIDTHEAVIVGGSVRRFQDSVRITVQLVDIETNRQIWGNTYKGKLDDIDISQLPDGEQFAEISRKVPQVDASRTMGVLQADLSRAGVEVCADQSSQAANKLRSLLR